MENKIALILLLAVLVVVGGLVYLNFFVFNQPASTIPTTNQPTRPLTPTPVYQKELERIKQEGGLIPFDYEVIAINGNQVTVRGDRGEASFNQGPNVLVFKKTGETTTAVDFTYLKVGQKLQIEQAVPPERSIKVYILAE